MIHFTVKCKPIKNLDELSMVNLQPCSDHLSFVSKVVILKIAFTVILTMNDVRLMRIILLFILV